MEDDPSQASSGPSRRQSPIALRRLRTLAGLLVWTLPALSTVTTVVFFMILTAGSPLITHPSYGRSINRGMLIAVAILLGVASCIWAYAHVASAIENSED